VSVIVAESVMLRPALLVVFELLRTRATELVEQFGVRELRAAVPFLRKLAEQIPKATKRRLHDHLAS
jgi:hypothetical protein